MGVYEIIREKNPGLKNTDIDSFFSFNDQLKECKILISDLACSFIVIQKYSLGKKYFGLNPGRDFDLRKTPVCYKNNFVEKYFLEVDQLLKKIDGRFSLNSKRREFKKHFSSLEKALDNIPGKLLITLLKHQLEQLKLINRSTDESFSYKLSKECSVTGFQGLKTRINNYLE